MKAIILAAGQGTRLRPLTDDRPKCMVEVNGKSLIDRQLAVMRECGIDDSDITVIAGYCGDVLEEKFRETKISVIRNESFQITNMVYSLMCARELMESQQDVLVSYGDIIYSESVLRRLLGCEYPASVVVDDGWLSYWSRRCENPLDDAETLVLDEEDCLLEIGQKAEDLGQVQSQYIGLMRFRGEGLKAMLGLAKEAEDRTRQGILLWRTMRTYQKMYMTDLLQGLIDEGHKLRAVHIQRGWFEIDNNQDLKIAEEELGDRLNTVYWITGLAGAGKTTIGRLLYKKLKEKYPNTVFLDGDAMREVFGSDLGYAREERIKCAMRYSKLCAMLSEQGMNVICCTISMFDSIRDWNREHIQNYREIYIKASMDTLIERDQKGLYSGNTRENQKEVAGIHVEIEEPKQPFLVLQNDGDKTAEELAEEILRNVE